MTQQEIIENNKLIAKFMGLKAEQIEFDHEFNEPIYKISSDTHLFFDRFRINDIAIKQGFKENNPIDYFCEIIRFKYHSSWDWLMPVIHKCFKYDSIKIKHDLNIAMFGYNNIEAVFNAVVQFVVWYDQNKNNE